MDKLLLEAVDRAVWFRTWLGAEIEAALFGAAADEADEAGDPDLAAGLRSGRCPMVKMRSSRVSVGDDAEPFLPVFLVYWHSLSKWNDGAHLDNLPVAVFEALTGECRSSPGDYKAYPSWQDAFRAVGRVLREGVS